MWDLNNSWIYSLFEKGDFVAICRNVVVLFVSGQRSREKRSKLYLVRYPYKPSDKRYDLKQKTYSSSSDDSSSASKEQNRTKDQ